MSYLRSDYMGQPPRGAIITALSAWPGQRSTATQVRGEPFEDPEELVGVLWKFQRKAAVTTLGGL
jgi:hypothetical protein